MFMRVWFEFHSKFWDWDLKPLELIQSSRVILPILNYRQMVIGPIRSFQKLILKFILSLLIVNLSRHSDTIMLVQQYLFLVLFLQFIWADLRSKNM